MMADTEWNEARTNRMCVCVLPPSESCLNTKCMQRIFNRIKVFYWFALSWRNGLNHIRKHVSVTTTWKTHFLYFNNSIFIYFLFRKERTQSQFTLSWFQSDRLFVNGLYHIVPWLHGPRLKWVQAVAIMPPNDCQRKESMPNGHNHVWCWIRNDGQGIGKTDGYAIKFTKVLQEEKNGCQSLK